MKLVECCVSKRTPLDAKGMGGVKIGGGTIGRVQLNLGGFICGGGARFCGCRSGSTWIGGCMVGGEIRSDRSWSMEA